MNPKWKLAQWAERRWWKSYLGKRDAQAYLAWKRAYWRNFLQVLNLDAWPSGPALDAGSGPAGLFVLAKDLNPQATWTALDPLILEYQKDFPDLFAQYADLNLVFESGNLETAPLPKAHFQRIVCLNAINHVANWQLSLSRLWEALAPGGQLILSSDCHRHNLLLPIFRLLPGDVLHPQQHDVKAYRQALRALPQAVLLRERLHKREFIFDYWVWVLERQG